MASRPLQGVKILLVQTGFLGDTLLSTPVVTALNIRHENSEVWILVNKGAEDLVDRHPGLKGVITFDKRGTHRGLLGTLKFARELRSQGFEIAYSVHRSFRTALILFLSRIPIRIGFRDAIGKFLYTDLRDRPEHVHDVVRRLSIVDGSPKNLPLVLIPPAESEIEQQLLEKVLRIGRYVLVAPGSVWATKQWRVSGFRDICSWLLTQGFQVVLCGSKADRRICEAVAEGLEVFNFAGQTSLRELAFLVSKAELMICNDSLPLHLASSLKIPTVAIFCATSPEQGFGPWMNRAQVVMKPALWCRPCGRHGGDSCPTGTYSCIDDLSTSRVIRGIEGVLSQGLEVR